MPNSEVAERAKLRLEILNKVNIDKDTLFLGRNNKDSINLPPNANFKTIHKSKGLECKNTVIVNLEDNYKVKKILKSLFLWFNKKYFESSIEPLILEIEKILKTINSKKFEQDKHEMIKMYNYSFDIKNN